MLQVESPYDGVELASLSGHNAEDLERMLGIAHGLFKDRSQWLPVHQRIEILERASMAMRQAADALALLIAREGGKPLTDARVEVTRAAEGVQMCVEQLRHDVGTVIPLGTSKLTAGRHARTFHEPIGVVAAVSAFNHPLNLIVHQVAPAVAAGCPVIVKPAPDTPLSCIEFCRILEDAGLPEGWCQHLITDDIAVSEALVTDPRLGFFSFIGSARVGWMLRGKLAPGVRCALEHGGAAPVILCADADLDQAVPAVVKGGFYHAGQVCVSVQRVYAQRLCCRRFSPSSYPRWLRWSWEIRPTRKPMLGR